MPAGGGAVKGGPWGVWVASEDRNRSQGDTDRTGGRGGAGGGSGARPVAGLDHGQGARGAAGRLSVCRTPAIGAPTPSIRADRPRRHRRFRPAVLGPAPWSGAFGLRGEPPFFF